MLSYKPKTERRGGRVRGVGPIGDRLLITGREKEVRRPLGQTKKTAVSLASSESNSRSLPLGKSPPPPRTCLTGNSWFLLCEMCVATSNVGQVVVEAVQEG